MSQSNMPSKVDDIVASVEDAVRRAYALGRADAMKRVVEMAQSDDPGLRAMALLGPAEPARPSQAVLDAPQRPAPAKPAQDPGEHPPVEAHERDADAADARHEARQAEAAAKPASASASAPTPAPKAQPARKAPASVGAVVADFFYPLGAKKR